MWTVKNDTYCRSMIAQAGSGFVGFAKPPAVLPAPDWEHMMRKYPGHLLYRHHKAVYCFGGNNLDLKSMSTLVAILHQAVPGGSCLDDQPMSVSWRDIVTLAPHILGIS